MPKNWEEILIVTIRNRRSVWLDNGWDADVNEMLYYIEEKYKEWWGNLERYELVSSKRAINICCQLVDIAEKHFKKISKERDLEYGKQYA